MVEELHVEAGIVNDQLVLTDEIQKLLRDVAENGFVAQKLVAKPVNLEGGGGHGPLRIDILMIGAAGRHVVKKFDCPDLDDPVAFGRLKPRGFGVQNDFTHRLGLGYGRSGLSRRPKRRRARGSQ